MYVLDTNICIELMTGNPKVAEQLAALGSVRVYVSAVTIGELAYGAMRAARPAHELAQVGRLTNHMTVIPVDGRAAFEYGVIKSQLAARGELLEDNDLFIAAVALSRDLTLVTHDRGFSRIQNLKTEDWLA